MAVNTSKRLISELADLIERLAIVISRPFEREHISMAQDIGRDAGMLSRDAVRPWAPCDADVLPDIDFAPTFIMRPIAPAIPDPPPTPAEKSAEILATLRAALPEIRSMVAEVMTPLRSDPISPPDFSWPLDPAHILAELSILRTQLLRTQLNIVDLQPMRRLNTLIDYIEQRQPTPPPLENSPRGPGFGDAGARVW